jgi:sulfite reductase beta subunit-like hemoprotein
MAVRLNARHLGWSSSHKAETATEVPNRGSSPRRTPDDPSSTLNTAAEKDLLKWVGVFFRKPTPGRFMMRVRMPNGFTDSRQLRAVAAISSRDRKGWAGSICR